MAGLAGERHAQIKSACASGNFLYVVINLLLDLEKQVIAFASQNVAVDQRAFFGQAIPVDERAVHAAEVVLLRVAGNRRV